MEAEYEATVSDHRGRTGRGPSTFKKRDVTRALKATMAAGLGVQRIEIDRFGKIVVITGKPADNESEGRNEWDTVH